MPSNKFFLNLFFLKYAPSLLFDHVLFPHFFLVNKTLKVKFFKTKIINFYWKLVVSCLGLLLCISLLFFI